MSDMPFEKMDNDGLKGYLTRLNEKITIEGDFTGKDLREYQEVGDILLSRGVRVVRKSGIDFIETVTPRIVVYCHGGLVQWVIADHDIEMLLIDADVTEETMPDNSVRTYYDIDDEAFDAEGGIYDHSVAPELVKKYFDQQEEIDKAEVIDHENASGDIAEGTGNMG